MEMGDQMIRTRSLRALAATAAVALVVAACGGDDDAGSTSAPGPAAATTTAAAATEDTTAGTAEAPRDTAEDTAATTGETTGATGAGTFGLIDECTRARTSSRSTRPTARRTGIRSRGSATTRSRCSSACRRPDRSPASGSSADGIQSYFNYINDQGGIEGRKLVLDVQDDGYQPDKTKSNVDEALGSGQYAAFVGVLGTANNLAVWDEVNDECMPHLFNGSGAPHWGDIENHPWTTGMQIDYFTEAGLWAQWLQDNHPDAKTVAAVAFNNDFGKSYVAGFERAA